jgi:hypothetical protein
VYIKKISGRPQDKDFGARAGAAEGKRQGRECRAKYEKAPKFCTQCKKVIPYKGRRNKFCGSSCSATYNNPRKDRKKLGRVNRGGIPRNFCKVTFRQCPVCLDYFRSPKGGKVYCKVTCNPEFTSRQSYRRMCKFKLNNQDYPELYNEQLIVEYGWYNPTNVKGTTNLTGVCWDHLYRISDGYKNRVDPKILAHPANAELVPWLENITRKESIISLEELYKRIKLWDAGQRPLKYFYVNS